VEAPPYELYASVGPIDASKRGQLCGAMREPMRAGLDAFLP